MKTWTRMLCSVQWCIGENDTTWVSFICRKENSASDWDRYPATTSATGQSSWSVISTCLPKISSSSAARAAGSMLQVRRRSLGWSPVSCQVMTRRTQGLAVIVSISASTLSRAAAGLAAGQGGGQLVEFLAGLGQRGAVEPAGLAVVQFRGVGQDRAALGAVDLAAGVVGGQPAEPVLHRRRCALLAGRAVRSGQSRGRAPTRCSAARAGQVREVGLAVLPGVEDHRHVRGRRRDPGRGADRLVAAAQLVDHGRELGDVGLVAGVGMPGQRDPAVPGDDQAQPDQPQVAAFLLGLAPLRDRGLAVRRYR